MRINPIKHCQDPSGRRYGRTPFRAMVGLKASRAARQGAGGANLGPFPNILIMEA